MVFYLSFGSFLLDTEDSYFLGFSRHFSAFLGNNLFAISVDIICQVIELYPLDLTCQVPKVIKSSAVAGTLVFRLLFNLLA